MNRSYFFFIIVFIVSLVNPLLAHERSKYEIKAGDSMNEILPSVNEGMISSIQAAGKDYQDLQKTEKEKGADALEGPEISIVEELQKILLEIRKVEKILQENLEEGKELSKRKGKHYQNHWQDLEEKVTQLKKRIKQLLKDIEKEYRLLQEPVKKRVQELLKEMEKAINRLQESLKEEGSPDKILSI